MNAPLKILIVSCDTADMELVRRLLEEEWGAGCELFWAQQLSGALNQMTKSNIDAVLIDLGPSRNPSWEMLLRLRQAFPQAPIIVLAGCENDEEGPRAIQCGAQDYLLKGHLVGRRLVQSIRHAIARQQQLKSFTLEARTDPLTGVLNRRAFEEQCAAEIQRARRYGNNLSCILLDLDRFKEINDTYGHTVGDTVLQSVAGVLLRSGRLCDLICRYGGDEFCVVLTETTEEDAFLWAQRIQNEIRDLRIAVAQNEVRLTTTAGIAQCGIEVRTPQEFVDLADQALLTGKHTGRDTVMRYSQISDTQRLGSIVDGQLILNDVIAGDVMTTPIVCLDQNATMQEAADLFLRLRINSAPVVDGGGKLQGIISEKDLLTASLGKQPWHTPLKTVMTTNVISYEVHVPAIKIWEFMSRVTIRRIVITDEAGTPVGVISRGSLLRWVGNWGGIFDRPSMVENNGSQEGPESKVPLENFREAVEAAEQEIRKLSESVHLSEPEHLVPNVVHCATRLQEHVQDLLAFSQVTYQFSPSVVVGTWKEREVENVHQTQ